MTSGAAITTVSISLQVPDGAEPGDSLEFQIPHPGGQTLELVVPEGSVPGDILEIQVATTTSSTQSTQSTQSTNEASTTTAAAAKKDTRNDITQVTLENGLILELASQLPTDHKESQQPPNDNEKDDCSNDDDGTYALPWQSGKVLAQSWDQIQQILFFDKEEQDKISPHRRRVLELGSGLGLVGLSLAMTCLDDHIENATTSAVLPDRQLLSPDATIVLTDVPAAMPLLQFNVEQNRHILPVLQQEKIFTTPLPWTVERPPDNSINADPASFSQGKPPFDLIVGSDLLYNVQSIPALVSTLQRHLHPTRGVVILAVQWRKPELERRFFQQTSLSFLTWELLPLSATTCHDLSWQDFGNPSCDASNKYFYQRQISVGGQPTSLAEITQDQAKYLPPQEFHEWERSFIQVYLGRPKQDTKP